MPINEPLLYGSVAALVAAVAYANFFRFKLGLAGLKQLGQFWVFLMVAFSVPLWLVLGDEKTTLHDFFVICGFMSSIFVPGSWIAVNETDGYEPAHFYGGWGALSVIGSIAAVIFIFNEPQQFNSYFADYVKEERKADMTEITIEFQALLKCSEDTSCSMTPDDYQRMSELALKLNAELEQQYAGN